VNKFLDSAAIALDAIWSAKLRSFMTVLGNIVAVTSIIAVVSLIQGLNASVKTAILNQAGADSFNIQQFPVTRSDDEFDKVRNNPRITMADMRAVRRYSELAAAVMADSSAGGRISFRDKSIDQTRIQGVTGEYIDFSTFDAERGRLMSPTEVDSSRPVTVIGWQTADRLFGDSDPLEKIIQIEGVHFRVVGVSAKKGSLLGQPQDEFAVIPLGQFQMMFGSRPRLSVSVKPRDVAQISQAMDEAVLALRIS
jgi:putative ABC transport system permease protein